MKKLLHLSFFAALLFSFTACVKTGISPNAYYAPVEGSWVISETVQSTGYGNWQHFNSGLEQGIFDFYRDGSAEYDDGYNLLHGNWSSKILVSGYYDQYGNYVNASHQDFQVHVFDHYSGSAVDLFFDDIVLSGNRLIATYYSGNYVSKYIFRRY